MANYCPILHQGGWWSIAFEFSGTVCSNRTPVVPTLRFMLNFSQHCLLLPPTAKPGGLLHWLSLRSTLFKRLLFTHICTSVSSMWKIHTGNNPFHLYRASGNTPSDTFSQTSCSNCCSHEVVWCRSSLGCFCLDCTTLESPLVKHSSFERPKGLNSSTSPSPWTFYYDMQQRQMIALLQA